MPISSGWKEKDPLCIRDESGRFLLAFRSDRGGQRELRAYLCWSRDAVHWSNPAMVVDRWVQYFDIIQDDRGRFVWADASGETVTILVSGDAYRWKELAQWRLEEPVRGIQIVQRSNGMYELFLSALFSHRSEPGKPWPDTVVWRYVSADGTTWSRPKEITRLADFAGLAPVSAFNVDGRTVLALICEDKGTKQPMVRLVAEGERGVFRQSQDYWGVGGHFGRAAHHPRWGYIICWYHPVDQYSRHPAAGPFIIRGPSVEPFFKKQPEREGR